MEMTIFVLISLFCLSEIYNQCNQLITHPKYTVGVITKFYYSGYAVKSIKYKYQVNGIEYLKGEFYQGGELGKRYFVKFSSENPRYNEFLENNLVPDSLQFVPTEGWDKIPEGLDIYKAPNAK